MNPAASGSPEWLLCSPSAARCWRPPAAHSSPPHSSDTTLETHQRTDTSHLSKQSTEDSRTVNVKAIRTLNQKSGLRQRANSQILDFLRRDESNSGLCAFYITKMSEHRIVKRGVGVLDRVLTLNLN